MQAPIAALDDQTLRDELKELVRKTVEDTINAMLGERADELVNAERH